MASSDARARLGSLLLLGLELRLDLRLDFLGVGVGVRSPPLPPAQRNYYSCLIDGTQTDEEGRLRKDAQGRMVPTYRIELPILGNGKSDRAAAAARRVADAARRALLRVARRVQRAALPLPGPVLARRFPGGIAWSVCLVFWLI